MPIEDPWRGIDQLSDLASAWSPLEIRAHQRMAELLHEAEQDRLARLARGLHRSGLPTRRSVALPRLMTAASPALVDVARRLATYRRGRGVGESRAEGLLRRIEARTMLHHGRESTSEG